MSPEQRARFPSERIECLASNSGIAPLVVLPLARGPALPHNHGEAHGALPLLHRSLSRAESSTALVQVSRGRPCLSRFQHFRALASRCQAFGVNSAARVRYLMSVVPSDRITNGFFWCFQPPLVCLRPNPRPIRSRVCGYGHRIRVTVPEFVSVLGHSIEPKPALENPQEYSGRPRTNSGEWVVDGSANSDWWKHPHQSGKDFG